MYLKINIKNLAVSVVPAQLGQSFVSPNDISRLDGRSS